MLETSIEIGINTQTAKDANNNSWPSNSGSYLQWNGIKAQYDLSKAKGGRVVSAKIGGVDLDPNQMVTVACNNYLATSSGYPELKAASIVNEYATCDEAVTTYLQAAGNERFLAAVNNGNVTEGKTPEPQPVAPVQKQSSDNPKTGSEQRGWVSVLLGLLV